MTEPDRGAPRVRIVEVSPRDGLQNEASIIPCAAKVQLVRDLLAAGARDVEVGSFVAPRWVPQMGETPEVLASLRDAPGLQDISLVPNMRGLARALDTGARRIAVFPAATETFSRRNLNASADAALARFAEVTRAALDAGVPVRGYVSVALHCPFEGWVPPEVALDLSARLLDMGCYEVSLCDTTGRATAGHAQRLFEPAVARFGAERVVAHFHDTYAQATANALATWQVGVAAFDASAGGLGGCPYAPGATGNVATEALVHLFNGLGVETGLDLDGIVAAARGIAAYLDRPLTGGFHPAA